MNNTLQALRMLRAYTNSHLDLGNLAGPAKASIRAQILSLLEGNRVPMKFAGVTAIRAKFHAIANVEGDCIAARDAAFAAWATALITQHSQN